MNIAFLFDSNFHAYANKGNYYWPPRRLIFRSGIIQASNRHMKMGAGDVIIDGNREERARIHELVFFDGSWGMLHEQRLRAVFGRAEILAIVFQNMTKVIAEQLHKRLSRSGGYLGLKSIEFGYPPHLIVFRHSIGTQYRMKGSVLRKFYSMGSNEGEDPYDLADLQKAGFTDVGYEDKGMRGTIFDDFDKPEHFEQIMRLRCLLAEHLPGGEDGAAEFVMELEDVNPALFNALGAAVDAVSKAQHEEHIAQAAVSGRRYMEKLADTIFPARKEPYRGRDVGKSKYLNRLAAYIEDNVPVGDPRLGVLGAQAATLMEELNGGVHGKETKEKILTALVGAAKFTMSLLMLNPDAARQAYEPFMEGFMKIFGDEIAEHRAGKLKNPKTTR
jgi:hypothetical protein